MEITIKKKIITGFQKTTGELFEVGKYQFCITKDGGDRYKVFELSTGGVLSRYEYANKAILKGALKSDIRFRSEEFERAIYKFKKVHPDNYPINQPIIKQVINQ